MIYDAPKAVWPLPPPRLDASGLDVVRRTIEALSDAAQYGWGHTIDLGEYRKEGLLGDDYLRIAGALDAWKWWPLDLSGLAVADVGCFTGGLSLYMASRGPTQVYAIDEIPEHLAQCAYMSELHGLGNVATCMSTIYALHDHLPERSLDFALVSGVLYHLSDMLVGLHVMQRVLKPSSRLVVESNAIDDDRHSYANFGRFHAGMWWQPTALCIRDMCEFMGFEDVQVRFYTHQRCLVRATATGRDIPFKRGLNWRFDSMRDARVRGMDASVMAPAPGPESD
jgi:SAM-dependent methyltransferase